MQKHIVIDGKKYTEEINCVYNIKYKKMSSHEKKFLEFGPNTEDDYRERIYLLSRVSDCVKELKKDRNTRKAAFANLYPNHLCKCICLVHLFIRNNKLNINEYYRSQEQEDNYFYDCQTACMIMDKALKMLGDKNLKPGKITVFCANFHKRIDD